MSNAPPPKLDSGVAPPLVPVTGARLGRYILLETIAEGGMGIVYAAFDSELDRKVAIKLLRSTILRRGNGPEIQARLLREAQAMARLSHPNVVAVHDVGTHEGSVFLAMDHVSGSNLKERLRQPGPWRERLKLLLPAGRGLAAAHAAGLIHRDFKPDNVLVGHDGSVRVTDFGIARSADAPGPETGKPEPRVPRVVPPRVVPASPAPSAPRDGVAAEYARAVTMFQSPTATNSGSLSDPLTVTGDVLGTIGYMAPEQAFGEHIDARSDQFSFCATLYLALYGERPFRGDDLDAYMCSFSGPVRDAPSGSKVPGWLRAILLKGLSVAPEDRYASMEELLTALEDDPALSRRRWLGLAAVVGVAAVAALGVERTIQSDDRACMTAGALTGAWDPNVRDDVQRAFAATGVNGATDSFERTAKNLDAYGATWSKMSTAVCEATHADATRADEQARLRGECLERARAELHALTSIFRRADRGAVEQSVAASYGLTALSGCDDVTALRASPGLPTDPTRRASVQEARRDLAEARSLRLAGKGAESLEKAEHALATARKAGHRSTEAEALFFVSHNRQRLGDYDRATAELSQAMSVAYGAHDDAVFIRTASDLAFILGDKLYRRDDSNRILDLANAGLERIGGGDELEAEVVSTEGLLQIAEGHPDRSIPLLERVIRIDRRVLGETPTTAIYLNDLGYAEHLAGRNEAAIPVLQESRAMLDAVYGVARFDSGIPLCNLGAANLALGHRPEATGFLETALDVFEKESPDGFWSGWTLQYQALAATLQGDPSRAATLGRRGLAIADRLASSVRIVPGLATATGDALLSTGQAAEALDLCTRGVEVQERAGLFAPDKVLDWDTLRCRGEALLALGRTEEAVTALERAVSFPLRAMPWDPGRAKLALARALAVSPGNAARVATLRAEAREALGKVPEGGVFLAIEEGRGRSLVGTNRGPGR